MAVWKDRWLLPRVKERDLETEAWAGRHLVFFPSFLGIK